MIGKVTKPTIANQQHILYHCPMARHNKIGNIAEDLAQDYLQRSGYEILERNWRFSRAEIDLICKKDEVLVFVEVKALSDAKGDPQRAVTPYKQALLVDAANEYMRSIDYDWEIRFDIISIVLNEGELVEMNHYKDAFFD